MHKLFGFQERRIEPPPYAEGHSKSDYTKKSKHESKYVEGAFFHTRQFHCPACDEPLDIEHGDRIMCDCNLIMENYGNSLVIWKTLAKGTGT